MTSAAFVILAAFGLFAPSEKPEGPVSQKMPSVPEMNIRRRFGEKTFLSVALDAATDVAYARLQLGFAPWAAGADGVVCEVPANLSAARDGAAADVELLDRMREVAARALQEKDPDRRLAGRKLGGFLANLDVSQDPDLLHLECLHLLRTAERALGLPETPLAAHVRDSVAGKLPGQIAARTAAETARKSPRRMWRPPQAEMAKWTTVNLRASVEDIPIGEGFGLHYSHQWRNLTVGFAGEGTLAKDEMPGGEVRIRLWVPDKVPDRWLEYDVTHRLESPPEANPDPAGSGWAPDPCAQLYVQNRRNTEAYPPRTVWTPVCYAAKRLWNRDYPYPTYASAWLERGTKPWTWHWRFALMSVSENLPMTRPGVQDVWFVTISYRGKSASARLLWPIGNEENLLSLYRGYALEEAWQKCPPAYQKLREQWEWGEDVVFAREFVKPVLDADDKLFEMIKSWNGHPPAVAKEVPKAQLKVYRELPRLFFARERIDEMRKAYLVDVLEGREPKRPDVKRAADTKRGPAVPDADDGEAMDLDEEDI